VAPSLRRRTSARSGIALEAAALARNAITAAPGIVTTIWRVARTADLWLPGEHAGRWNRAGLASLYASGSDGLSVLEALVHLETRHRHALHHIGCIEITHADVPVQRLDPAYLPRNWKQRRGLTQAIGSIWLREGAAALLLVPSALTRHDSNVLINPAHRAWRQRPSSGHVSPFWFDRRLLRQREED
jgi:RES domain-containing protein